MMTVWMLVLWASVWRVGGLALGATPCSCDCCNTAERPPSEQLPNLKYKCQPPPMDLRTDQCGDKCSPSAADVVMSAAKEDMDYSRYCQYKCRPSSVTVGTLCIRLDAEESAATFVLDGNGDADAADERGLPVLGPLVPEPVQWEQHNLEAAAAQVAEEEKLAAASSLKASIHYDVQEVMTNRVNAEAAAAVARASASEARAKADVAAASRSAQAAQQAEAVGVFAEAGKEAAVESAAVAQQAQRDAQVADSTLQEVLAYAKTVVDLTEKDAVAEIKKQVAKPMAELAETHAKMWGWDKPKFWPQVEAVRAADPYGAQMTVAIQRMDEYERMSKSELGAARGDQEKAISLTTQANAMEAQGDRLGAANLRHEIAGLIASAKGHQATAQAKWNTANTMRDSVPQWQDASLKAATFASWKFQHVFTPPPSMFLQRSGVVGPTPQPA